MTHHQAAGSSQRLGSLRSPRAPHIQPLSATIHHEQHIHHHSHIQPHTATYSHHEQHIHHHSHHQAAAGSRQQADARLATLASRAPYPAIISPQPPAGSRPMLGSLRSPRAPHIQPLSATIRQQHPNRSPLPPPAPVARALLSSGLCQ